MRVTGQFISATPNGGKFNDREDPTRVIEWSHVIVKIFDGREVVKIKCKGDAQGVALSLLGSEGQTVTVDCESPADAIPTNTLTVVPVDELV